MVEFKLKDSTQTRLLIAKTGNTLRSFSSLVDISQGYLSQVISLKRKPSAKVAYKIATGLGVSIEDIFLILVNDISIERSEVDAKHPS